MSGADEPSRAPRTLFSFKTPEDIKLFATGCDADVGGLSSVHLDLYQPSGKDKTPYARFWGDMRLDVKPQVQGRIRGGYAAMRNKVCFSSVFGPLPVDPTRHVQPRPTLFGETLENIEFHDYLALRVRLGGDPSTHNAYYVNLQTNGPISTDVWQHRLFFKNKDNQWEDIFIPFKNFVRTNNGELAEIKLAMSDKLRTIGISVLGGNSGSQGRYDLGIDNIRLVNAEDAVQSEETSLNEKQESSKEVQWENLSI
jgi:NADH dehydrogenase [ubiquinone] 1 alpha subcomplex assembly factor 1